MAMNQGGPPGPNNNNYNQQDFETDLLGLSPPNVDINSLSTVQQHLRSRQAGQQRQQQHMSEQQMMAAYDMQMHQRVQGHLQGSPQMHPQQLQSGTPMMPSVPATASMIPMAPIPDQLPFEVSPPRSHPPIGGNLGFQQPGSFQQPGTFLQPGPVLQQPGYHHAYQHPLSGVTHDAFQHSALPYNALQYSASQFSAVPRSFHGPQVYPAYQHPMLRFPDLMYHNAARQAKNQAPVPRPAFAGLDSQPAVSSIGVPNAVPSSMGVSQPEACNTSTPDMDSSNVDTPNAGSLDTDFQDMSVPEPSTCHMDAPHMGTLNTGAPSTGNRNLGTPNTGTLETGCADAGSSTVGNPDIGLPSTGIHDIGLPDVGLPDTGNVDTANPGPSTPLCDPDITLPDMGPLDNLEEFEFWDLVRMGAERDYWFGGG